MLIPTDACGLHITRLAPWRSTTTYQALLAYSPAWHTYNTTRKKFNDDSSD